MFPRLTSHSQQEQYEEISTALTNIKALKEAGVGQKRQHQQEQEQEQERRQEPQQHSAMAQLAEKSLYVQASSAVLCIDCSSVHLL
jgi:hypothetical protein